MEIQEFVDEFTDAIEVDAGTVDADTRYQELEVWDSLAVLVVIAMIDARCNVAVSGQDLKNTATISELLALVKSRAA